MLIILILIAGGMKSFYEGILPMTAEAVFKVGIRYFAFQMFVEQYNASVHGDAKKPATYASLPSHLPMLIELLDLG